MVQAIIWQEPCKSRSCWRDDVIVDLTELKGVSVIPASNIKYFVNAITCRAPRCDLGLSGVLLVAPVRDYRAKQNRWEQLWTLKNHLGVTRRGRDSGWANVGNLCDPDVGVCIQFKYSFLCSFLFFQSKIPGKTQALNGAPSKAAILTRVATPLGWTTLS